MAEKPFANLCVFGRPTEEKNELVVVAFDLLGSPGNELLRIPLRMAPTLTLDSINAGASGFVSND